MIFAANLKCNHTRASFKIYAKILNKTMGVKCDDIIVFPPSIAFFKTKRIMQILIIILLIKKLLLKSKQKRTVKM